MDYSTLLIQEKEQSRTVRVAGVKRGAGNRIGGIEGRSMGRGSVNQIAAANHGVVRINST